MATFYGQVRGQNRTTAHRCGSLNSHIECSLQSYKGSLTFEMYFDDKGQLSIDVFHAPGESRMGGGIIWSGAVEGFAELLKGDWS